MRLRPIAVVPALVALTFILLLALLYSSTYFFVFDDTALLAVARDSSIEHLLARQTMGFWRPAGMLTHKLNLELFGWESAGWFSVLGIAIHAASALLILRLALRLGFGNFASTVAFMMFLASPWATEALMWMSAQFDVFAVFFMLVALNAVDSFVRASNQAMRLLALLVMSSAFTISLLYKENAVVAFIFTTLIAWRINHLNTKTRNWMPVLTVGATSLALTLTFVLVRNQIMDGLNGPYGSLASMWEGRDLRANAITYLDSLSSLFSRLPNNIQPLAVAFLLFVVLSLAASFRRPGTALVLLGSLAITLLPTLWSGVSAETTVASRFTYLPGVVWALTVGFGSGQLWEWLSSLDRGTLRTTMRTLWCGLTAMALTSAMVATLYQSQWWRFAVNSGRLVVDFTVASSNADTSCIYVTNLPSGTFEGPHVLKSYNLSHHFAARGLPTPAFRSDHVVISRFDGLVSIPQPEGFSEQCTDPSELAITLPLDQLRP